MTARRESDKQIAERVRLERTTHYNQLMMAVAAGREAEYKAIMNIAADILTTDA